MRAWQGHAYVGLAKPPAWPKTDAILEMFGPQRVHQQYREFLGEETDAARREIYTEWQGEPWGQTRRV